MRVFHRKGAGRPVRVVWALEETGADYEVVRLTAEETAGEEHRHRHPLGRVPVLEDDEGATLFESAALAIHVADLYPQAELIAPIGTRERALAYQWTIFAMTEIEPAVIEVFRFHKTDPERAQAGAERFALAAAAVQDALDGHDYLVGDAFTVADLVVSSVLTIATRIEDAELLTPPLKAYLERLEQRPARQRAYLAIA